MTKWKSKYRKRIPPVTAEELALYRADPNREEKTVVHGFPPVIGITDWVVCRECGKRLLYISTAHFHTHGLTAEPYGERWPGAPLYSSKAKADRVKRQRKWVSRQDPEELAASKHNDYLAHKAERIAAAIKRNKEKPKEHKKAETTYRNKPEAKKKTKVAKAKHSTKIKRPRSFSQPGQRTGTRSP
jgi:hypothetical protein